MKIFRKNLKILKILAFISLFKGEIFRKKTENSENFSFMSLFKGKIFRKKTENSENQLSPIQDLQIQNQNPKSTKSQI